MTDYRGIAYFDMDGVLANCLWRLKFLDNGDYTSFYDPENIKKDTLIYDGRTLLNMYRNAGYKILIVTSRRESCRDATWEWLKKHDIDIPKENIYLRANDDTRKSWEVKKDLVKKANKDHMRDYLPLENAHFFVDDYPENCEAISQEFPSITTVCFGVGRMNTGGC